MQIPRSSLYALICAAACLSVPSEAWAGLVTIDFDSAVIGSLYGEAKPGLYVEDGFRIDTFGGHYDIFDNDLVAAPNPPAMNIDNGAGGAPVIRLDYFGRVFDFLGVDVLYWIPNSGTGVPTDEIAFIRSSVGGYKEITAAGALGVSGADWHNVTWIEFGIIDPLNEFAQDNLGIDNIRVQDTPEPATIFLLGTGLLIASFRRTVRS